TLPVVFNVVQPVGGLYQRLPLSNAGDREIYAIFGLAECHVLMRLGLKYAGSTQDGRIRSVRKRTLISFFPNLADKADAPARNGADELLLFAAVADGVTRGSDPAGQGGLGYDPPMPDGRQQVILAYHTVSIPDQMHEKIEDLRLDVDHVGAAMQLAPLDVESVFSEPKAHSGRPEPIARSACLS